MNNSKKLNLDDFKLAVKQDNKKVEELMGGIALAGCHTSKSCGGGVDID